MQRSVFTATQQFLCFLQMTGQSSAWQKHLYSGTLAFCDKKIPDTVIKRTFGSKKASPFAEHREQKIPDTVIKRTFGSKKTSPFAEHREQKIPDTVIKRTFVSKKTSPFAELREQKTSGTVIKCRYVSKKTYPFAELREEDLEENFVRGSGPGGQSVNQTANCVVLKHKPSGIVVKCHETRSLEKNQQRARERLCERLDWHLHGNSSFLALQEQEASERRKEKKKKNKVRLELKKAFKEREGLD